MNRNEFYPLNWTHSNMSMDLDISCLGLQLHSRFIGLNGSLVRNERSAPRNMAVQISMNKTFSAFDAELRNEFKPFSPYPIKFEKNDKYSSEYRVLNGEFEGIDTIHIRVSMVGDFTEITGFQFQWSFSNPSSDVYARYLTFLMSVMVGYALVAFCLALKLEPDGFTQVFVLVLGGAGVLASNPLRQLLFDEASDIWDHVFAAFYVAVYRLFLKLQLDVIRAKTAAPRTLAGLLWVSFFVFYGLVEATATFATANRSNRASIDIPPAIQSETWRAAFAGVYIVISLVYLGATALQSDGTNSRRLWFWAGSIVITNLVTFMCHVMIRESIAAPTAVARLVFASVHSAFAAMAIFMLHSDSESDYTMFDPSKTEQNGLMLDIDDIVRKKPKLDQSSDDGDEEEEDTD
jgi:hypothetical protein